MYGTSAMNGSDTETATNGVNRGVDEGDGLASTKDEHHDDDYDTREGSSVLGAVFNFTKSIVGAGITGLGGAFAISGGFISIVGIIFCVILSKISFDLLIYLSIVVNDSPSTTVNGTGIRRRRIESSSYEELGATAFGGTGRAVVIISKAFYTFGTMVVYNIVVKDNCASAMSHLLFENDTNHPSTWWSMLIQSNNAMAVFVSAAVILPLCLLRDLKPLEKSSIFGMISIIALVMIVMYLYFTTATGDSRTGGDASTATGIHESSSLYAHWFQVRGGVLRSLGTFIFTFIAHATVHLAYDSIHPQIRNYKTWKLVSSISLTLSTFLALIAGIFVYMTFWLDATSSMFVLYPPSAAIDISKILLTITIALTFPFLMLACREIIIVSLISLPHQQQQTEEETTELLESTHNVIRRPWLLPGRHRQLTRGYHVLVTTLIWLITLILALVAPSLGDVLNLVGCATGTVISFILPAVFSFKIIGFNPAGAFILLFGFPMGVIGTYVSVAHLLADSKYNTRR